MIPPPQVLGGGESQKPEDTLSLFLMTGPITGALPLAYEHLRSLFPLLRLRCGCRPFANSRWRHGRRLAPCAAEAC